jgi:hypothetical protein
MRRSQLHGIRLTAALLKDTRILMHWVALWKEPHSNQWLAERCHWNTTKSPDVAVCFMLISGLAYPSFLKMKVTHSSEMSVCFQRATQPYSPTTLYEKYGSWSPAPNICRQ